MLVNNLLQKATKTTTTKTGKQSVRHRTHSRHNRNNNICMHALQIYHTCIQHTPDSTFIMSIYIVICAFDRFWHPRDVTSTHAPPKQRKFLLLFLFFFRFFLVLRLRMRRLPFFLSKFITQVDTKITAHAVVVYQ